jgi:hypothetical protein
MHNNAGVLNCSKRNLIPMLLSAALFIGFPCAAQSREQYEDPPIFRAVELLPKELLKGPQHEVKDRVVNDGYMNHYTIESNVGVFRADSNAELRIRVQEIYAIVAMDGIRGTAEFAKSFKQAGANTLRTAKNAVLHPIDMPAGAASGVGRIFEWAGENLFGDPKGETEDRRWKQMVGFSKTKREYAAQFGVDVYSSNQVLQEKLDDIAWAGYAGGLSVEIVTMPVGGAAGTALTALGATKITNDALRTTPPADLRIMNHEKLAAMGVDPSVIELFMLNGAFSPTHQTLLVAALDEMKGVADRGQIVRFAVLSDEEDVALFRQRQAQLYLGYHKSVDRIERFVPVGQLAAARTRAGHLVFALPLDYLAWSESMARVIEGTNRVVGHMPGIKEKQLWLAGSLSPMARRELEKRGWKIW